MNGSPMQARRTHARTCCVRARARVRVRLGAHESGAGTCEGLPSAWTAGGSACRRSRCRRRTTRTSARGTRPQSPRCARYAPPFRARLRAPAAGRARRVVDAAWLCSQAFTDASAFNANIGAWNTAGVTTLFEVCAAFPGPAACPCGGRARRVVDAARAVVRGGAADAFSRECVRRRVGTRMRGCPGV
jgi:hypothetical protein